LTSAILLEVDGRALVVSGGKAGALRRWDALTGEEAGDPMLGHDGWVNGLASGRMPGGAELIVSCGDDATVRRWNAATGEPIGEPIIGHLRQPSAGLDAVTVGRRGGRDVIVSGGGDHTARMWDLAAGAALGRPMEHPGTVVAVAMGEIDDQQVIVTGCTDAWIRVYEASTLRLLQTVATGHAGELTDVAVGGGVGV